MCPRVWFVNAFTEEKIMTARFKDSGRARVRRALFAVALTVAATGVLSPIVAANDQSDGRWVGSWATAVQGVAGAPSQYNNQTIRLIVRTTVGGNQVRVRLSNELGSERVLVGAAHIALRNAAASIVLGTDRTLTFGGAPSITIPPGAPVLSDPVTLDVPPLSDLAVSVYLPHPTSVTTVHLLALQTSYRSPPDSGDLTGDDTLLTPTSIGSWPFLTGVHVRASKRAGAIVILGDSITDGAGSTFNANRRWPDVLSERLQARPAVDHLGVLNQGIIGNRLLRPGEGPVSLLLGPAGLARFDRDVLTQAGIRYLIVLLGINDLGTPPSEEVSVDELIAGYRQLIERAHQKGIKVLGATLSPFEGTTMPIVYSPEAEEKRQAINEWIRTSNEYDGLIDFDRALRDPSHLTRLLPLYDSGDHLHPNDAGTKAMGEAIPLRLFREE
jgi:lysophospholipase L1-like esterase